MDMGQIGVMGLLWIPKIKGLAIHGGIDQVIDGRNVGKSFTWMAGLQMFHTLQQK
jgi:hypothetical protein